MSLRTKVIGCLVGIFSLFLGASLYNYSRFKQANERLRLVNELFLPLSRLTVQTQINVVNVVEEIRRFHFKPEGFTTSPPFSRVVQDVYPYLVNKRFNSLEQLLARYESSEMRSTTQELTGIVIKVKDKFNDLTQINERAAFEKVQGELKLALQELSKTIDDTCQRITLAAQAEGNESLAGSLLFSVVASLLGIAAMVLSDRGLRPLPTLIESLKKIADGDFNQSLKVNLSDKSEVATLAREYNRMLSALSERDKKICVQQNEIVQKERLATVGQLSAEIVHEIRNPLNAISLNIDWLESELSEKSSPDVSATLRSLSKEIERLNQITESYLVRARVPVDDTSKTEVNELLKEILMFSREEDKARQIQVIAKYSPQSCVVKTERAKLKQALINLLKNAREAMPRGGSLKVSTELKNNVYRIQVSDTGHGMNDATRKQTFRPFYTTKPNGTGLGLTLTRDIVEEAGGNIHCESQIGVGTVFTLQFPV